MNLSTFPGALHASPISPFCFNYLKTPSEVCKLRRSSLCVLSSFLLLYPSSVHVFCSATSSRTFARCFGLAVTLLLFDYLNKVFIVRTNISPSLSARNVNWCRTVPNKTVCVLSLSSSFSTRWWLLESMLKVPKRRCSGRCNVLPVQSSFHCIISVILALCLLGFPRWCFTLFLFLSGEF
jgi:hypothetical protein